jgi:hypothetical protein
MELPELPRGGLERRIQTPRAWRDRSRNSPLSKFSNEEILKDRSNGSRRRPYRVVGVNRGLIRKMGEPLLSLSPSLPPSGGLGILVKDGPNGRLGAKFAQVSSNPFLSAVLEELLADLGLCLREWCSHRLFPLENPDNIKAVAFPKDFTPISHRQLKKYRLHYWGN